MPRQNAPINPTVQGSKYRQTFQSMVNTIVGPSAPPVYSRGSRFYNVDRWTARVLTKQFCDWAAANPKCVPTEEDITKWVHEANHHRVPTREIVVANCPDRLPRTVLYGIQGGGCHEGFHTRYSCRRKLTVEEVASLVLPRWAQIPNWAGVYSLLQGWSNVVEDIRIERLGRVEFPGTDPYLHDLQDFILLQEAEGIQNVRAHSPEGVETKRNKLTIITGAFRDHGLGYETPIQDTAWAGYIEEEPEAVRFVLQGPLRPMVEESIGMPESDDLGCLRVAMDCVIELVKASKQDTSGEEAKKGEPGDGEHKCPKCGAAAHKLVVRPKSDGKGGQLKGKGICTCTECGHQQDVNVTGRKRPKSAQEQIEGAQKGPGVQWEGWGDLDEEAGEGARSPGEGEGGEPGAGESHQGVAAAALLEVAGGEETELLDNNSALGAAVGLAEEKEASLLKPNEKQYRPWDPTQDIVNTPTTDNRPEAERRARKLLASVKSECAYMRARMSNIARALEMTSTIHGVRRGRALSERLLVNTAITLRAGAIPRRAYMDTNKQVDLSMAVAVVIDQSSSMRGYYAKAVPGSPGDGHTPCPQCGADPLALQVGIAHIQPGRVQGSVTCSGCDIKLKVGLRGKQEDATRMLLAIAEPCERLGFAVQCSGFRDGLPLPVEQWKKIEPRDKKRYHRFNPKIHDVFKRFDEKLRNVLYRFALVKAMGSTPLADGIQFGLDSLSYRNEAHRALIVLTDGEPTEGHDVIPWQIRVAREAGVHVIGVGIGQSARGVQERFDDWIWDPDISRIPKLLSAKLNQLVDIRAAKRGRRIKKATPV